MVTLLKTVGGNQVNRLWTVIAVLAGAFPFVALGFKLFETSTFTGLVYSLIVLILVGSAAIAVRANITLPTSEAVASPTRAPRPPAPPIEWSWDGVNRQPEGEAVQDDDQGTPRG